MPRFEAGIPITTREPQVSVEPGLKPGRHLFRLEVVDSAGNRSRPAELVVTVKRAQPVITEPVIRRPIVIDPVTGRPVVTGKAAPAGGKTASTGRKNKGKKR